MLLSYQEALDYLYLNLPVFHRVGASAYKKDLTNTLALCASLGNPQRAFRSVHVAGTNGKGSTSHMLASVLQSAGYTTGLYTSPHLKDFTERIRVNGAEIPHAFVVDFVNRIRPAVEEIMPSFFETTVAMAFDYFAQAPIDVAVIEVGLGGRLDSTNVITPELSVITNISWDHKDLLGDTLEKIAYEKAGIIKSGIPVVVSERQPAVSAVFEAEAAARGTSLMFASDRYRMEPEGAGFRVVEAGGALRLTVDDFPLRGFYQRRNVPGVVAAVEALRLRGFSISEDALVQGLREVTVLTGLKGRWQILGQRPLTVCDTGHNEDGVREVVSQLAAQTFRKLHIVWGSVNDKDITAILRLLPKAADYYFCQAQIPRALDAYTLAEQASAAGLRGEVIPDVNEAFRRAKARADEEDMIFIGGSTFVVAELENL